MSKVIAALLLAAIGCTGENITQVSTGETPQELLDRTCAENKWNCQKVYAFEAPYDNPLGRVELCVNEKDLAAAELMFGKSEFSPDPRFNSSRFLGVDPPCIWCGAAAGCNAYNGCFACPTGAE